MYIYFLKKYQHKFHWISVTNSEPSNAYSTKSGSNYPDQQHVPRVDFCLKITYKITIYNIDIHQTSQQLCGYNMRRHWFMSRRWFQIFSPSFIPNWFPLHYSVKHDMRLGFLYGFLHGLLHGLLHHSRHFLWHERFMNGSQCWKKRCYVLDLFSSILQIFCDTKISKMLVARSCGRAAASQCRCNVCRVRFSAHIHQVKSSACSVWIGCVTSSLLLSFLMVCSCLWCFIL